MSTTYAVEKLADTREELEELLPLHWDEIARDKDIIKLEPDWATYENLERVGQFHMMVARYEGKMIGYAIYFVRPHLHYLSSLSAICDIYFIHPLFRSGRTGLNLFKEAEKSLKMRGVQKIFTGTKVFADKSVLFEHLGYRLTEKLYTKVIS
jgi:N-acetylglutamate synthase-like GNAT family acetyltransferase